MVWRTQSRSMSQLSAPRSQAARMVPATPTGSRLGNGGDTGIDTGEHPEGDAHRQDEPR